MAYNNNNGSCGCGPTVDNCKVSTTTSNCGTSACPPPVVYPPVACPPGGDWSNPPTITIENL